MKKQYDEYELKLIEWLKTFKNRRQLRETHSAIYQGCMRKYSYLLDESLPVVISSTLNKNKILDAAKNGYTKPKKNTSLGRVFFQYISKSSESYDSAFTQQIKEIRPDWFPNKFSKSLETLLKTMPTGVSFDKGQTWRGLEFKYYFTCKKYGKFYTSPKNLISRSWKKGLSGHPKDGRISAGVKNAKANKGKENKALFKTVKCLETGQIFKSVKECADKLKLSKSHVGSVALGKRKSTGGYTFVYVEEEK